MEELGKILIFDDDRDYLDSLTTQLSSAFAISHFDKYPPSFPTVDEKPFDAVVINLKIQSESPNSIHEKLKSGSLTEKAPVIYLSDDLNDSVLADAFDTVTNDILVKSHNFQPLARRLECLIHQGRKVAELEEKVRIANSITMRAMQDASDYGEILKVLEQSYLCESIDELASLVIDYTNNISLSASLKIYYDFNSPRYFCCDKKHHEAESEFIDLARHQQRIVDLDKRSLFNFQHCSLLIRNMPVDDNERYGILKDHLCIVMNAAEAKVHSLITQRSSDYKQNKIVSTVSVLNRMIKEMEHNNNELSTGFQGIIENLESNVSTELVTFSLLEKEEKVLMSHIQEAVSAAQVIFGRSIELEKAYSSIMSKLVAALR